MLTAHRDMVSSEQFDLSSDAALLELTRQLVERAPDGNQVYAMGAFLRIQGAMEFVSQMKHLAEPVRVPTPKPDGGNLDHKA